MGNVAPPAAGPRQGDGGRAANGPRGAGKLIPPSRAVIGHNVPGSKNHDEMVCYSCQAGMGPPDANGVKHGHVGAACPKEVIKQLGETWPGWLPDGERKDPSIWDASYRYITQACAQDWLHFLARKNITTNFDSSGRTAAPDFLAIAQP